VDSVDFAENLEKACGQVDFALERVVIFVVLELIASYLQKFHLISPHAFSRFLSLGSSQFTDFSNLPQL
jgi:hypothetical protein